MIHGETRIVLRNPISNNILKDITSENTFQNIPIQQYMRSLGVRGNRLSAADTGESNNPKTGWSWKNTLGGILLFQNQIPVGDLYMQAGNRMVGNGSYKVTNGEEPNELGSYNSQESSASPSAITQVYDFATNQANGQIGCVCLTSQTGGLMGYGNPSGQMIASSRAKGIGDNTEAVSLDSGQVFWENKIYRFSYNNPILTMKKIYTPVTQSTIKNGMEEDVTFDLSNVGTFSSDMSIREISQDNRYVYLPYYTSNNYRLAPSAVGKYYKIDLQTETITQESFTNTSNVDLAFNEFRVANGQIFVVAHTNPSSTEIFDIETNVHLKELTGWSTYCSKLTNGLTLLQNNDSRLFVYDRVNDTVYPINMNWSLSYNMGRYHTYEETANVFVHRGYNDTISLVNSPLYLATINNLNSPVTKTAAQTMKVTYTLTEA